VKQRHLVTVAWRRARCCSVLVLGIWPVALRQATWL